VSGAVRTLLLAAVIAIATWAGGWTAVPLVAFLWGAWRRDERNSALAAGFAASIGWGILLGVAAVRVPVLTVAEQVGGLTGVPGVAVVGVTLVFAFALAWSAAEVARTLVLLAVRRGATDE
jgi:hypothetical protein